MKILLDGIYHVYTIKEDFVKYGTEKWPEDRHQKPYKEDVQKSSQVPLAALRVIPP